MKNTKSNSKQKINALLEVGLEEIPARFMPAMIDDLKQKAGKELQSSRLSYSSVQTYGTPRRLILYIEGLPVKQDDLSKEVRGPQKQAAFSGDGKPTKAAEGFAKSQGVSVISSEGPENRGQGIRFRFRGRKRRSDRRNS